MAFTGQSRNLHIMAGMFLFIIYNLYLERKPLLLVTVLINMLINFGDILPETKAVHAGILVGIHT